MKIAFSRSFEPQKAPGTVTAGAPLLAADGARVSLGWAEGQDAVPIAPAADTLFGPRGACLHPDGSFWIADTGHHRLLGWPEVPRRDNEPASIVIGQPDFAHEGRNAKGAPGMATLNVPTGVSPWGAGLAVADAWNHRVLLWRDSPRKSGQPADIVLGQADGSGGLANCGADHPDATTLHWPYGVLALGCRLLVADTGNRRVLIWNDPTHSGQPADLVLGQSDFLTRDENAGAAVGQAGMRWPHGIAFWREWLAVSDAGNNRVMLWRGVPTTPGASPDLVLGQKDFVSCDHNGAAYYPSAATVNMPYAVVAAGDCLIAADTANSRLIGWTAAAMGAAADRLAGQPDFASKGDNRWGTPTRDSLCWPYGLSALGQTIAIADSGNNRVLLWDRAP